MFRRTGIATRGDAGQHRLQGLEGAALSRVHAALDGGQTSILPDAKETWMGILVFTLLPRVRSLRRNNLLEWSGVLCLLNLFFPRSLFWLLLGDGGKVFERS